MANNQQLLLGEGAGSAPAVYIEDVFSTYLYTGNGSTQTITNNIDLSTKGGLVWIKDRLNPNDHLIQDTARGVSKYLVVNANYAEGALPAGSDITAFNANGFSLGTNYNGTNNNGFSYASWTFREQKKFFDVVTYTGDGVNGRTISHNLGSVPGCMIVKCTSTTGDWYVWHVGAGAYVNLLLNSTSATVSDRVNTPTLTGFNVQLEGNTNGATYVAYLFAHNAGGFGLAGTDNVISCGSYTGTGAAGNVITLGYEPQFVMFKQTNGAGDWKMYDVMRGLPAPTSYASRLEANSSGAEYNLVYSFVPTATGMESTSSTQEVNSIGATYIYIAIRRGPMKVPTVGTSVFAPFASSGATGTQLTTNFPVDSGWFDVRGGDSNNASVLDRLRGVPSTSTDTAANRFLKTSATAAETTTTVNGYEWWNTGIRIGPYYATYSTVYWLFGRAPGFFDEVCYTSDGTYNPINHNLTVVPELVILKMRDGAGDWYVYNGTQYGYLNTTAAFANFSRTLTTTTFVPITQSGGNKFVTYLFATCAGVSKVGSYTGNGSSQTIACGFAAGSRWVMIKRTDSTGDWYVWDSARGIVAGNDPHLSLNTTAAEVTTDDSVDTDNSGFIVNQDAATNVNVSSAQYLFLAIS